MCFHKIGPTHYKGDVWPKSDNISKQKSYLLNPTHKIKLNYVTSSFLNITKQLFIKLWTKSRLLASILIFFKQISNKICFKIKWCIKSNSNTMVGKYSLLSKYNIYKWTFAQQISIYFRWSQWKQIHATTLKPSGVNILNMPCSIFADLSSAVFPFLVCFQVNLHTT